MSKTSKNHRNLIGFDSIQDTDYPYKINLLIFTWLVLDAQCVIDSGLAYLFGRQTPVEGPYFSPLS